LGALTTLNALNYLDRYVAAATLPLILADLAISDAQGGLLQSLFIVAYSLACGPAGWLGDAGKRLRLVASGVFVWSIATVASGLAPTYGWLLLARAVIGIGEASYAVVTPSLLSDCYPAERRARMLGIFYAAIPIGSALGYIVGGVIGEAHGWRAAYFVRERGIPLTSAAATFGLLLVVAGFAGTLLGGRLSSAVARRHPSADFIVSGWSLAMSIVFTLFAVLAPQPAVFWPAIFVTLLLLFVNIGPTNAAMANVLPAELRARGFAVTTLLMHLLGDAASPWLIGVASDQI